LPYLHNACGGPISWIPVWPSSPRCMRCGKAWSWWVVYGPRRKDMDYVPAHTYTPHFDMGHTSYASWADRCAPPGVAYVASHLPPWPRWLRLVSFFGTLIVLSGTYYGLYLLGVWAIITGTVILIATPTSVAIIQTRKRKVRGFMH
jgi:hypothetical protein